MARPGRSNLRGVGLVRALSPRVLPSGVLAAVALALGAFAVGSASAELDRPPVRVVVGTPNDGETVRGRLDMVRLDGLAEAGVRDATFDVILVVDVSFSTNYPSGIDVDEDGTLGDRGPEPLLPGMPRVPNTDPDDSILGAEILAAQRLLGALDPERVRVGVVSFSGFVNPVTGQMSPQEPSAVLEQPLTSDFDAGRRALEAVLLRGASGGTDMQAGLKLAIRELAGLEGAVSTPIQGRRRVILLLTDGLPSLPFGDVQTQDPEDIAATVSAAELAAGAGIKINVFGLGRGANDYPAAATRVSQTTGGAYVPVRRPGDVVAVLTGVSFANVEDVVAVNLTIGQESGPQDIEVLPDGSFRGFVPVRPGVNRIRVSALATDGSRGSTELEITFRQQDLSDRELEQELARVRSRNREIQLLTERRRQEAFRRAEAQRGLTLEVEDAEDDEEKKP